jgi:glutamyl-Q tRNA(Asp) synthetase
MAAAYVGRFAPSPTGLLHAGSVVAALASWLDARAAGGQWLVRIEDIDTPRCVPGAAQGILAQLGQLGLWPDEPPLWQSERSAAYDAALTRLIQLGWAYPCGCTRQGIAQALAARGEPHQRTGERVYPGTCRQGLHGQAARAWRLRTGGEAAPPQAGQATHWTDRRLGPQQQNVMHAVGDFVLKRADGLWAYQLAVVVDDAAQGVTHVVRGEDLADNTARQNLLQRCLGLPTPYYLHTPLVMAEDGHKLSKQNGAKPVSTDTPELALQTLKAAARVLDLPAGHDDAAAAARHHGPADWLPGAIQQWRQRWPTMPRTFNTPAHRTAP